MPCLSNSFLEECSSHVILSEMAILVAAWVAFSLVGLVGG